MASYRRLHILISILVLIAVIAFLSATSRIQPDSVQELNKDDWGSAQEAFAQASRALADYCSTLDGHAIVIDPQFRATLHSRTKTWAVKGYASCPTEKQLYRWTVILDYDGVQEWEIVEKFVTPISASAKREPVNRRRPKDSEVEP